MNGWRELSEIDVEGRNADLKPGMPTAEIALYYPSNLDPEHSKKVTVDLLVDGFDRAKDVFAEVGVQLRLRSVRSGPLDPKYFAFQSSDPEAELPSARFVNMYRGAERAPSRLSADGLAAFDAVVGNEPGWERLVHLVVFQDVFMVFQEPIDYRTWNLRTISTGGLSFPTYMYGSTIPRHLRGVISITDLTKDENSWKTVAHEIGHKLLNVSHEYLEMSPEHEIRGDGGLMIYGKGVEIGAGIEGRFHRERLLRSPFIYRTRDDGTMPRRRMLSENESGDPSARGTRRPLTKVPEPRLRSRRCSFARTRTACRAVMRLTPKRSQSSASEGRRSPGSAFATSSRR